MGINPFSSGVIPQVDLSKEEKEFYKVFTTKVVGMTFDTLEQAQAEAEGQARRYPGLDIKIWAFKHIKTVRVPTGEPLTWGADSSVDQAIKSAKEAGKKILDNPFDLVEKKIEEVKDIHG